MQVSDILSLDRIRCNLNASSKKRVLEELAGILADADEKFETEQVFDSLLARERLGTTGLGKGIAIPHGRLKNGEKTIAALVRTKEPIDYDAIDKQPVDTFFALLVPEESTNEHLEILSVLAEMFSNETLRQNIRSETDCKRLLDIVTHWSDT